MFSALEFRFGIFLDTMDEKYSKDDYDHSGDVKLEFK